MRTLTLLPCALLAVAALGCGAAPGEIQAKNAKALAAASIPVSKQEPGPPCTMIGVQQANDPKMYAPFANFSANSDDALQNLREKAQERGANYIVLDWVAGPMANGRLYSCPPGFSPPGGPRPASAPVSASACKPDCSPGFACVDGACVSACNPACKPNQQCGADRVCH